MCLLLGCILLIATVVSFPLYRNAAFDRMLADEFNDYLSETGLWPCTYKMTVSAKNDRGGESITRMEKYFREMNDALGVTAKEQIYYYSLSKSSIASEWKRFDLGTDGLRLGFMSGLPEHAKIISGQMYSESGLAEDGAFEVVVNSNSCLVQFKVRIVCVCFIHSIFPCWSEMCISANTICAIINCPIVKDIHVT